MDKLWNIQTQEYYSELTMKAWTTKPWKDIVRTERDQFEEREIDLKKWYTALFQNQDTLNKTKLWWHNRSVDGQRVVRSRIEGFQGSKTTLYNTRVETLAKNRTLQKHQCPLQSWSDNGASLLSKMHRLYKMLVAGKVGWGWAETRENSLYLPLSCLFVNPVSPKM